MTFCILLTLTKLLNCVIQDARHRICIILESVSVFFLSTIVIYNDYHWDTFHLLTLIGCAHPCVCVRVCVFMCVCVSFQNNRLSICWLLMKNELFFCYFCLFKHSRISFLPFSCCLSLSLSGPYTHYPCHHRQWESGDVGSNLGSDTHLSIRPV